MKKKSTWIYIAEGLHISGFFTSTSLIQGSGNLEEEEAGSDQEPAWGESYEMLALGYDMAIACITSQQLLITHERTEEKFNMGRREVTAAPSLEEEFLAVVATEEELLSFGDMVSKLPVP